jgi:predicted AlkP superfamily pyrophosphatase or phosphodiesterase
MDRPNLFTLAKNQRPEFTGMAAVTWAPVIEQIFKPFDTNNDFLLESFRHLDTPDGDFIGDRAVKDFVLKQMNNSSVLPDISFIGFNETDEYGHKNGFGIKNQSYLHAISTLSELSGEIIEKAETQFPQYDKLYIFTTDHGGRSYDNNHSDPSTEYTRRTWTAAHAPNYKIKNVDKIINAEDISALAFKFLGLEFPNYYDGKVGQVKFKAKTGPRSCKGLIQSLL